MVYTGTYIDENGVGHEISLTEEDSIEALKNDRDALLRRYNTQRVTVRQVKAQEGEAMRFQLTLHAPTHYLTSEDDTEPKPCDEMTCTLVCMPGYPITPMKAATRRTATSQARTWAAAAGPASTSGRLA